MVFAYLVVAALSAAVAVFALQNNEATSLRFLAWSFGSVPLAGALLVALAAGVVLAAVPLSISNWRLRSRVRRLDAKVEMLESALTTRDTAALTPRSTPAPPPPSSMPTTRSA